MITFRTAGSAGDCLVCVLAVWLIVGQHRKKSIVQLWGARQWADEIFRKMKTAPPVRNILSVKFSKLWFPCENLAVLFLIVWKMKDGWLLVIISTAINPFLTHFPLSLLSSAPVQYSRSKMRDGWERQRFMLPNSPLLSHTGYFQMPHTKTHT